MIMHPDVLTTCWHDDLFSSRANLCGVVNRGRDGAERDLRYRGVAVEQHAPLEEGGAEEWVALMHLVGDAQVVDGHQADRFGEQRIGPRGADRTVKEGAPIESLMLGPHRHEKMIRREVFGGEPGEAQGYMGKPRIEARVPAVRDKEIGR